MRPKLGLSYSIMFRNYRLRVNIARNNSSKYDLDRGFSSLEGFLLYLHGCPA